MHNCTTTTIKTDQKKKLHWPENILLSRVEIGKLYD